MTSKRENSHFGKSYLNRPSQPYNPAIFSIIAHSPKSSEFKQKDIDQYNAIKKGVRVKDIEDSRRKNVAVNIAKKTLLTSGKAAKGSIKVAQKAAKKTIETSTKAAGGTKRLVDNKINRGRASTKTHYILILMHFFGPFIVFFLFFLILYLGLPNKIASRYLISGSIYIIPSPAGDKTVLISTAPDALKGSRYLMAVEIAVLDTLLAWFLCYNLDLIRDWKTADRFISFVEKKSLLAFKRRPWIRKVAIGFLALFVIIPMQGSGGLTASAIGKFMGLKPWKVILSIGLGSLGGCLLIAYAVDTIKSIFTPRVQIILFIILVSLVVAFFFYSNKKERRLKKELEDKEIE